MNSSIKSILVLAVGFALGVAFTVWFDVVGVRFKDLIRVPAVLEISNGTDMAVSIHVRDSVVITGPTVDRDSHDKMRLPHIGLYEVSAIQPDGKVFTKQLVAVGDNRRVRIEVRNGEIVEF